MARAPALPCLSTRFSDVCLAARASPTAFAFRRLARFRRSARQSARTAAAAGPPQPQPRIPLPPGL
eukprot:3416709-Lingulodinium_polyedra.AAC.1